MRIRSRLSQVLLVSCCTASAIGQVVSEEAYDSFALNCQSCHTIGGGRLTGPDLEGVLERRERDWLVTFMLDPKAMIDSGDPYAQDLLREARGVIMPTQPTMTRELAGKFLDLIEIESSLEKSRFAGLTLSDRPLTPADVARGKALFSGEAAFASGAPACFSCHTLSDAPGFGGGRLGPDLTAVYARLEGRKALGAWLSAPPSVVMSPVFRATPLEGEEILALTAYFKDVAESGADEADQQDLGFLLTGLGLAAALLVVLDALWSDRYRATRRPMVEGRLTKTAVEGRIP